MGSSSSFLLLVAGSTAVAFVAGSTAAWGPKLLTLGLTLFYGDQSADHSAELDL